MSPEAKCFSAACRLCPRLCRVERGSGKSGFCRSGTGLEIASICLHRGEEPPLGGEKGICNVFFYHCQLQCVYCQNWQISRNDQPVRTIHLEEALQIIAGYYDRGVRLLGFVSASHMIPAMIEIISALRVTGRRPRVVFNCSGYERPEILAGLEDWVDVYLPDFKYADTGLGLRLSGVPDYPLVAWRALLEMTRQKGLRLALDDQGLARTGVLVRHLVLPGQVENSLAVLRLLAEISPLLSISLLAQYRPNGLAPPPLDRCLNQSEYDRVLEEMSTLGFINGWRQELSSADLHCPDFDQLSPFN